MVQGLPVTSGRVHQARSLRESDFPHAYYGDNAVLGDLDAGRAREVLRLTGPKAPLMSVVQINHLGGATAKEQRTAVPFRAARYRLRILNPLGRDTEAGSWRPCTRGCSWCWSR
ncbi:hypothetical protein ACWGI0_26340 [Streptomyces sp. NPDC054802]